MSHWIRPVHISCAVKPRIVTTIRRNKSPVANYLPVTPAIPVPGGVDEVLWLSAKIVPKAAPAARAAPTFMSSERVWCCLAGAIAIPAGLAAAPPVVGTLSAVAAPTGSVCGLGFGASGTVVVVCGSALGDVWSCCAPEASGYVVTGASGACDGFTLVPGDAGCCCCGGCCCGWFWFAGATGCVFCAGAVAGAAVVCVVPGCAWSVVAGGIACAGCVGCWLVSGACCGVAVFVCCARSNGAEHSPASNRVLRILVIRYCTVIKTSGNFGFLNLLRFQGTGISGKRAPVLCSGRCRQQPGQISVSVPMMLDAVFEAAG